MSDHEDSSWCRGESIDLNEAQYLRHVTFTRPNEEQSGDDDDSLGDCDDETDDLRRQMANYNYSRQSK